MRIDELVQDESFKEKIKAAKSLEDVASILSANGIAVSSEDIAAAFSHDGNEELDESALENVAGGRLGFAKYLLPILPLIPMPIIPGRYKR